MCAIRSPLSEIRRLFSPISPSNAVVLDSVPLLLVPIWFRNATNSAYVASLGHMKENKEPKRQRVRFIETTRELGCDEDENRFNETLKRIAPKTEKEKLREG